jgi:hypothetical protein
MSYYNLGDSFHWFMARVVDIKDEERLGRVKIRVIHDQTGELGLKKETFGLEDEDLLWAYPMSAIQSASLSWKKINELEYDEETFVPDWIDAVGLSPTGIAVGTYCFGFYLDGHEANIPMIFGTYHKVSMYPEPGSDPQSMLQDLREPPEENFKFHDVSSLAKGYFFDDEKERGGSGQTLPKEPYSVSTLWKDDPKKKSPVDEFPTAYSTEYPYNTTYTTKSGHAIEIDDTPKHERIHIWHRSGCYEEISNGPSPFFDGDTRSSGDKDKTTWPDFGPSGYSYVTAGGVTEDDYLGRRSKKTMDSSFEVVVKDKNQLLLRDHNVEVANTSTQKIGNTAHWTIGWDQTPDNRKNNNGRDNYQTGAIDSNNLYLDVSNNTIQTTGNNYVLSVGVDPANEYRLTPAPIEDKNNFILTVANNQKTIVGGAQITTIQQQHYMSVKEDSNIVVEGFQKIEAKGGLVINAGIYVDGGIKVDGNLGTTKGASGSFTSADGKVVTVIAGIVTAIT